MRDKERTGDRIRGADLRWFGYVETRGLAEPVESVQAHHITIERLHGNPGPGLISWLPLHH